MFTRCDVINGDKLAKDGFGEFCHLAGGNNYLERFAEVFLVTSWVSIGGNHSDIGTGVNHGVKPFGLVISINKLNLNVGNLNHGS